MKIDLYVTEDSDTVMNKDLVHLHTANIELRDTHDITAPIVLLGAIEGVDIKKVNYAYMEGFERYYFVRSVNVGPNNIYALALECDVIETYKEDILDSMAEISRGIQDGDYRDISPSSEVRRESDVYESNRSFGEDRTVIMTTIGEEIT